MESFEVEIDLPEPRIEITEVRITCGETKVIVKEDSGGWAAWISHGYIAKDEAGADIRGVEEYREACERARDYVVAKERRRLLWLAVQELLDAQSA